MALDVQPGSVVSVTVNTTPTNEAAAKTLSRIFAKDVNNRDARRRRKELRQSATEIRRRGGRPWAVLPKAPRLIQPTAGAACQVRATVDVIADMNSVERFIQVEPVS